MKTPFIGLVAALVLTVHAASAADLGLPIKSAPPPPPPGPNWTGCYVNGGGGYGMWNQDNYFEVSTPGLVPLSASATNGGRGWFGVAGGGCDYQFNLLGLGLVHPLQPPLSSPDRLIAAGSSAVEWNSRSRSSRSRASSGATNIAFRAIRVRT
jgi:opacity protein-like surface antigen